MKKQFYCMLIMTSCLYSYQMYGSDQYVYQNECNDHKGHFADEDSNILKKTKHGLDIVDSPVSVLQSHRETIRERPFISEISVAPEDEEVARINLRAEFEGLPSNDHKAKVVDGLAFRLIHSSENRKENLHDFFILIPYYSKNSQKQVLNILLKEGKLPVGMQVLVQGKISELENKK